MNTHEIERIADAMHRLRPDWPVKQLKTLLATDALADRPRRDVCVALAWVACETASANPYRVLEAGPWWQAAAIEGRTAPRPDKLDRHERCSTCSESRERHDRLWANDHPWESLAEAAATKAATAPEHVAEVVRELKGQLAPTKPAPEPRPVAADPRATQAREAIEAMEESA